MIYADTSCLLKVFLPEPLGEAVETAIGKESRVVISTLVELELLTQFKAAWAGGLLTRALWRQTEARLAVLRSQPPYEFRSLPSAIFQTALRQHRNSGQTHCRALDRLHLAAMEELEISRLMTHDEAQAKAAIEAGFEVIRPGC